MARIFFPDANSADNYFCSLKEKSGLSWELLAVEFGFSNRQFCDWRARRCSFPGVVADFAKNKYGLNLPLEIFTKEDNWHIKDAARKGARRRFELYGELGTPEGRRKGGINSQRTHKIRNTGIFQAKKITRPRLGSRFAEIIGALIGDGGITKGQVRITLNSVTDKQYASYLIDLLSKTFGIGVSVVKRKNQLAIDLLMSSTKLVDFLNKRGLLIGNKLKQGLDIPRWVNTREAWQRACLRGLFDTDGCTYTDHHLINNKTYVNPGLAFTSYSKNLRNSYARILKLLSFSPTLTTRKRVLLRREIEIVRFFEEIKPKNSRHWNVYNKFLEEYRSGYNGTASKAVVPI